VPKEPLNSAADKTATTQRENSTPIRFIIGVVRLPTRKGKEKLGDSVLFWEIRLTLIAPAD
jgi:hypothetical protein